MNYGIQLYSLRDISEKNFEETFKVSAELGFEFAETAGFFGHSAEQVKEWLDKYNLRISGTHTSLDELDNDFEGVVKYHKIIGNKKIIVPWAPMSNNEALEQTAKRINKYQPMLSEHGIEMGYHNHFKEFVLNDDAVCPIAYLSEKTNIKFEIDTYWAFVANHDPIAVMEEYRERLIGCIHLKDGRRYPHFKGCSLGEGSAPVRDVIAKAKDMKLEMIVESEDLDPTGKDEVARCADFLKVNG